MNTQLERARGEADGGRPDAKKRGPVLPWWAAGNVVLAAECLAWPELFVGLAFVVVSTLAGLGFCVRTWVKNGRACAPTRVAVTLNAVATALFAWPWWGWLAALLLLPIPAAWSIPNRRPFETPTAEER